MQKIQDHAHLSKVIESGRGYVLNGHMDRKVLHRATCSFAEIMSPGEYDKFYFGDLSEAVNWCNKKFGTYGWKRCGQCL